ncbi:MAG: hypothetical protein LBE32_05505 [Burkholderiales bacterium]|jgi:type II secretory pathway component PulC|nr:hypothetical protein [Burkholderiales bacterium]
MRASHTINDSHLIATAHELLKELKTAHVIIKNALNIMTVEQKIAWGEKNASDCVDGDGVTRANERVTAIEKAEGKS